MQGQFINDKQVLLKAAEEAGVEGAQHLLDTEDELKSEVSIGLLAVYMATMLLLFMHLGVHSLSCIGMTASLSYQPGLAG